MKVLADFNNLFVISQNAEKVIEQASLDKAFDYVVRYFIQNVIPK